MCVVNGGVNVSTPEESPKLFPSKWPLFSIALGLHLHFIIRNTASEQPGHHRHKKYQNGNSTAVQTRMETHSHNQAVSNIEKYRVKE